MKGSNTSKNNFSWNCPSCLKINAAVIGSRVAIWWNDDQRAYTGKIDAYDSHSECHRILYDDGEWEFSDLSYEPYFLLESANSTGSNNAL